VGVANAYDGMMLAALAIAKADQPEAMPSAGFLQNESYDGLIKKYTKPFSTITTMRSAKAITSGRSSSTIRSSRSR